MLIPFTLFLSLSILGCTPPQESGTEPPVPAPERRFVVHPTPAANAQFGYAVVTLDFDGDGERDVAASAPGEGALYVFLGPDLTESKRFPCPGAKPTDLFGETLAAGPLDEFPGDDVLVGAPGTPIGEEKNVGRLWIVSSREDLRRPIPIGLGGTVPPTRLGSSVAVGDFDGDGRADIAAGGPKARLEGEPSGAVFVFSLARRKRWRIDNPIGSWKHGNFGHVLATADANGDGQDDLFVSALGNRNSAGVRAAGQCYVLLGPLPDEGELPAERIVLIEDPTAAQGDGSRFGMSIDAGDVDGDGYADFLIGAPRKNGGGVSDAGQGFLFYGPDFTPERHEVFLRPDAKPHDILGFKSLIANVVGDERNDVIIASLARDNPRAVVVWDGADLKGEPVVIVEPEGGSAHYLRGMAVGARHENGRDELVLGDPENPAKKKRNVGRILVERY